MGGVWVVHSVVNNAMLIKFFCLSGRGVFSGKLATTSGKGCGSTPCSKIPVFEKSMHSVFWHDDYQVLIRVK